MLKHKRKRGSEIFGLPKSLLMSLLLMILVALYNIEIQILSEIYLL